MDSIEPVRPRPPAIALIDATHVRLLAGEREGSAGQRRRQEREGRDGEAAQDAGEELPSVVVDADLLDNMRARNAEHDTVAQDTAAQDTAAQDPAVPDARARAGAQEQPPRDHDQLGDADDGRGHIDLTV